MISILNSDYSWKNTNLAEYISEGNLPSQWLDFFYLEEVLKELNNISLILEKEAVNNIIYPPLKDVFKAFYKTPLSKLKCILIAQDPYHNGNTEYDGSANGLCFSIRSGNKINPSLRNIYKELKDEGIKMSENGDLTQWAENGVLMLNMSLTVLRGNPNCHSTIWKRFSELLMKYIDNNTSVQWILLGREAIKLKDKLKNGIYHCTSHPSPLGARKPCGIHKPFLGSKIFSKIDIINWSIM